MVDGGQDSELLDDDEDTTSDGDEDLAHDEVADGLVGATEVDHQTLSEDVQGHGDVEEPLEAAGLADQPTDEEEQDTGDDVERVTDVTGFGNAQVVDNLQERGEVVVPAVVGELVGGVEQTSTDNGTVEEEAELEERHGRNEPFVQAEENQHHDTDDDHRDNVARGPAVGSVGGDIEGKEEDAETGREEKDTNNWKRLVRLRRDSGGMGR